MRRSRALRRNGKPSCKFVKKPLPTIALVRNQPLEQGQRCFRSAAGTDRDFAKKGRNSVEVGDFSQKTANFRIGIFLGLQSPVDFEKQLLAIDDGGVRLLRGANVRRQPLSRQHGRKCTGSTSIEPAPIVK